MLAGRCQKSSVQGKAAGIRALARHPACSVPSSFNSMTSTAPAGPASTYELPTSSRGKLGNLKARGPSRKRTALPGSPVARAEYEGTEGIRWTPQLEASTMVPSSRRHPTLAAGKRGAKASLRPLRSSTCGQ